MKLYKYLPEKTCLEILKTGQIRFTQPSQFNDPFEFLPNVKILAKKEFLKLDPSGKRLIKLFNYLLKQIPDRIDYRDIIRILNHTNFENSKRKNTNEDFFKLGEYFRNDAILHKMRNAIGVFSLSNTKENLLMWSHYANNHTGVVIEFDGNHPFFKECIFHRPRKVIYINSRLSIPIHNLTIDELTLRKSKHWCYEKEYRVLRPIKDATNYNAADVSLLSDKDNSIYLYDLPKECIKKIIFGSNNKITSPRSDCRIGIICLIEKNFKYVEVEQACRDDKRYKLRFDKLKYLR